MGSDAERDGQAGEARTEWANEEGILILYLSGELAGSVIDWGDTVPANERYDARSCRDLEDKKVGVFASMDEAMAAVKYDLQEWHTRCLRLLGEL